MGKGSGNACVRAPLAFGGLATKDQPMLDPAAAWRNRLETWMDECDISTLEAELAVNRSFVERLVIARRIRELRGFTANGDYALEAQPSDDELREELLANQYQGRALFVEGSPFADGLLYASMKQEKATKTVVRFHPGVQLHTTGDAHWPPSLDPSHADGPDFDSAHLESWRMRIGGMTHAKITCKGETVTEHDILNNFKRRRANLDDVLKEALTDERLDDLVAWVWEHRSIGMHNAAKVADPSGKNGSYGLYADVTAADEHEFIEHLVANGAKVTPNPFKVPNYMSWANIKPGKRFSLDLPDGGALHYVPHYSVGKQKVTSNLHSVTIPPLSNDEVERELETIDAEYDKHRTSLEEMVVVEYEYHKTGEVTQRIEFPDSQRNKDKDLSDRMREMAATGEEIVRAVGHPKYERTMRIREATHEEIATHFGEFMVAQEDGSYLRHRFATSRKRKRQNVMRAANAKPITVTWRSNDPEAPHPEHNPAGWQQYLAQLQNTPGAANQQRLQQDSVADRWSHEHQETVTFKSISHGAPMSERGTVRIEGTTPERLMRYLQMHEMADGYTPLVPYSLAYPGDLRRGRVIPKHDEYVTGAAALKLRDDHCVIHGMTGVQSPTQAVNRLKMIHQHGGLKSISERARMGIGRVSMSPKGDIASGIDHGVPTKIGNVQSYGTNIYFIMRPEVLERRDCWFSNTDFGGGHDRYDQYNQYAAQIGQGKMHHPAPHHARQKHLKSGLGNTNEAYLKHEISWDEIAVLCVDSQQAADVEKLVKKWKSEGSVPQSLRVESFHGGLTQQTLAPIANRLNKAYRQARGLK